MLASLALSDTPLTYRPAKGSAVPLTLTYSQCEAYQPKEFHYANLGPKWNYTGIVSKVGYREKSTFIDTLTTPYGVSRFATGADAHSH